MLVWCFWILAQMLAITCAVKCSISGLWPQPVDDLLRGCTMALLASLFTVLLWMALTLTVDITGLDQDQFLQGHWGCHYNSLIEH